MVTYELPNPSETKDIFIDEFSPFSPHMLSRDSYPGPEGVDDIVYNQTYAARAASTPLTPEELGLVRDHLGDMFHDEASTSLRWRRCPDICDYANKQTAVYFVGGGSKPNSAGHRHGYLGHRLGCYIYRTWHALHGGRPNLQRHHFFAEALRVPESEAASWTIPGLVAAHPRLRDATAARLGSEVVRLRCEDTASGAWPLPAGTARTGCEHGLSLHRLFRAVVLVADEHVLPVECPVQPVPEIRGHNQAWKVAACLERLMPECSVLMVRTGGRCTS